MIKLCSNCKWWSFDIAVKCFEVSQRRKREKKLRLGHCAPKRDCPGQLTMTNHHCGLTVEDYTCGEWKRKDD